MAATAEDKEPLLLEGDVVAPSEEASVVDNEHLSERSILCCSPPLPPGYFTLPPSDGPNDMTQGSFMDCGAEEVALTAKVDSCNEEDPAVIVIEGGEDGEDGEGRQQSRLRQFSLLALKLLLLCIIVCCGVLALLIFPKEIKLAFISLFEFIGALGPFGPIALIGIYVILTVFAVPGTFLTIGAGFLFGFWIGLPTVIIASNCGASAAFLVGRWIARGWVSGLMQKKPVFAELDLAVQLHEIKIILLVRLSPILPFCILNYACAVTSMRWITFAGGSVVGMLPGTIAIVYIGSLGHDIVQVLTGKLDLGLPGMILFGLGLCSTLALTIILSLVGGRILRRTIMNARKEKEEKEKGENEEEEKGVEEEENEVEENADEDQPILSGE